MEENMMTLQTAGNETLYGLPLKAFYYPKREGFRDLAADYNLVTVVREVEADLETPISSSLPPA